MLVLSRKEGQAIEIPGEAITVRVLSIRGNRAQIGIDAPGHVRVVREEILFQDSSAERPSPGNPAPRDQVHRSGGTRVGVA